MNNAIQQAIRALQSEPGWIELCRHYFPACAERHAPPVFKPLPQAVPGSLLGHIQAHGRVVVGVQHAGVPWFDVLGSNIDHIGVEFDLGRALAGAIFGDPSQVEFRRATLPKRVTVGSRIRTHIRNRVDEWLRAWTIFSTFVSSSWWYMGMRGRLPGYLCPPSCVNQLDFVSFDYYFGMSAPTPGQIRRLALSMQRQFNRTALWAGGLHQALHYYHTLFPDLPILIAENGFAGEPFGEQRGEQISAHVRAIQRAVAEGIDVRAYCVWSITSNREWGLPQEPASDFGLYYVDMDGDAELQRRETPSVDVYRKLIEGRGAS